ncbi:MAG: hypothetical protein EBS90_13430 [Betaproteobacteria bacterium]|nr:hypothetical protein [Betaproteobacteria bacterium]
MVAILDMPESSAKLGEWLDRALMSEGLARVVDELAVVHQTADEAVSVEQARDWLGDSFSVVMERGLGELGHARLKELLKHPNLLPAIQELALIDGGPYWNRLMRDIPVADGATVTGPNPPPNRRWLFALASLAVAASIAAFIAIDAGRDNGGLKPLPHSDLTITRGTDSENVGQTGGEDKPWGWNRTDLLDGVNSPGEIPARLADGLNEWFSLSKGADSDLQTFSLHVNELWAGCEQFSTQKFGGMPADLQNRLHDRVATFQRGLETVLATLDGPIPEGEKDSALAAARKSVDSSVSEAVKALRELK